MTIREFLNTVVSANISDEITNYAKSRIAYLDKQNAKRAATPSKTAIANEPIKAQIVELVKASAKPMFASEIGTALTLSTQKVSALCRQLVEAELLSVSDMKVKGKGSQKAYTVRG